MEGLVVLELVHVHFWVALCPLVFGCRASGVLDLVPEHWHRGPGPGSPGGQSCLLAVDSRCLKAACLLVGGSMSLPS